MTEAQNNQKELPVVDAPATVPEKTAASVTPHPAPAAITNPWIKVFIAAVVLGVAFSYLAPQVADALAKWRTPSTDPVTKEEALDAGSSTMPASGQVLLVNSGRVAADVLDAIHKNPQYAGLLSQQGAVGAMVGKGIRQAAAVYADKGYTVLDSSAALGVPKSADITGAVQASVMADLARLAQSFPATATAPAQTPAPNDADASTQTPGRLP